MIPARTGINENDDLDDLDKQACKLDEVMEIGSKSTN